MNRLLKRKVSNLEVTEWISRIPFRNLNSLVDSNSNKNSSGKHQRMLLAELLRHLLQLYIGSMRKKKFSEWGKSLVEHALEVPFSHKLDLPDQIWDFIFRWESYFNQFPFEFTKLILIYIKIFFLLANCLNASKSMQSIFKVNHRFQSIITSSIKSIDVRVDRVSEMLMDIERQNFNKNIHCQKIFILFVRVKIFLLDVEFFFSEQST